ncbi:hypothetical protein Scep_016829 [Stephania cephalantha]|uniref:Uncharacterized protein n=1 Tax=Stephania cephalantha TaxID=152367 RepID=A0AAP0NWB2_9MAGN
MHHNVSRHQEATRHHKGQQSMIATADMKICNKFRYLVPSVLDLDSKRGVTIAPKTQKKKKRQMGKGGDERGGREQ